MTHPHPGFAEPAHRPRRFLLEPLDTVTDPRVRMQPFGSVIGSTKAIHGFMFACRYDHHLKAWHSYRRLKDADQRSAAVAALANEICAKARFPK